MKQDKCAVSYRAVLGCLKKSPFSVEGSGDIIPAGAAPLWVSVLSHFPMLPSLLLYFAACLLSPTAQMQQCETRCALDPQDEMDEIRSSRYESDWMPNCSEDGLFGGIPSASLVWYRAVLACHGFSSLSPGSPYVLWFGLSCLVLLGSGFYYY